MVQPRSGAVTSAQLWFDAGSADEAPDQAGAAHFVEHMLFKGTERRAMGVATREIEQHGGDLNAWTSLEETVLHATVPEASADALLDVLFDLAQASQFDPEELERERLVVLEEMRGYDSDPEAVTSERLHERLFGSHPYGRPVIGRADTVSTLQRPDLVAFWRAHYHPGRAVLAVVGAVREQEVLRTAERLSAGWPRGMQRRAIPPPPTRPGELHRITGTAFDSVSVTVGWPGPPVGHPDEPALDVLVFALAEGTAARLPVLLDLEHAVAGHVWGDSATWRGGGMISFGFTSRHTERALQLAP